MLEGVYLIKYMAGEDFEKKISKIWIGFKIV